MIRATFSASVADGRLVFAEPARLAAWLALAKAQPVQITIERESSRRSTAANARYWSCIIPFCQEVLEQRSGTPFTPEMAHHFCKLGFLGHVEAVGPGGEVILIPTTTTKLTTAQFAHYCDAIEAWISTEFQVNPELLRA